LAQISVQINSLQPEPGHYGPVFAAVLSPKKPSERDQTSFAAAKTRSRLPARFMHNMTARLSIGPSKKKIEV